jgi:hypothetical protein
MLANSRPSRRSCCCIGHDRQPLLGHCHAGPRGRRNTRYDCRSVPADRQPTGCSCSCTGTSGDSQAGSLTLLISFVMLVIVLGTMASLIGRWRKRKILERTGSPNLSFTNEVSTTEVAPSEASADQDEPEPRKVA